MAVYLTKRWGETLDNPDASDLTAALEELRLADLEHPDCWLADESGWTVSAFDSGLVILVNPETNEGPWHMRGISKPEIVRLWNLLASGKLDEIKQLPWKSGYS
jgi:hypothetical protein